VVLTSRSKSPDIKKSEGVADKFKDGVTGWLCSAGKYYTNGPSLLKIFVKANLKFKVDGTHYKVDGLRIGQSTHKDSTTGATVHS